MKILLVAGAMALACSSAAVGQRTGSAQAPAGFAPMQSPCAVQGDGSCVAVSTAAPLPTTTAMGPASVTPLTGTSTGAQTVGPFVPVLGRPITLALSASSWPGGNVQLLRSTDGGVTKLPLTPAGVTIGTYSGPGADSPWIETESGAGFYLSLPGAGITYRVAQ